MPVTGVEPAGVLAAAVLWQVRMYRTWRDLTGHQRAALVDPAAPAGEEVVSVLHGLLADGRRTALGEAVVRVADALTRDAAEARPPEHLRVVA